MFAAFYRDVIDREVTLAPVGMIHRDGNPFDGIPIDGDDNACVDFRFSSDPRMKWWFDHHPTAFQPAALREVYERAHSPSWFFDPSAPSCAGLIRRALAAGWQWSPPPHLADAVAWADKIDAAQFASAEDAVALTTPAQRLAAWLAHGRTHLDTAHYVQWLSKSSLAEVATRPEIAPELAKVEAERAKEIESVKRIGRWRDHVIVFDRIDDPGARSPGFLGYLLFPQCQYAVTGTRAADSIKITVGHNPWSKDTRSLDIGGLCAKYGGGGHAVVGGVTLRADEVARARQTLDALVGELTTPS